MEKKVIDYTVVSDTKINLLTELVKTHIEMGYQPIGGMTIENKKSGLFSTNKTWFHQPMVKYN